MSKRHTYPKSQRFSFHPVAPTCRSSLTPLIYFTLSDCHTTSLSCLSSGSPHPYYLLSTCPLLMLHDKSAHPYTVGSVPLPSLPYPPSPPPRVVKTDGCPGYDWFLRGHTKFNATASAMTLKFPLAPVISSAATKIGTGRCVLGVVGVALNGVFLFRWGAQPWGSRICEAVSAPVHTHSFMIRLELPCLPAICIEE